MSLGSSRACLEAGFSSQNGDRDWGVYYGKVPFCCAFLWAKGLNAKDIHKKCFLFLLGSVCRIKQFHVGGKRFVDDEEVETEVRKWLRQQSKNFYAAGFDALVKRWGQVYQCWWRMCRDISFPSSNITCSTFYIQLWPIYWLSLVILSYDRVTIDRVWIDNWIYWTLTDRNYK
jgi:hypothetical protein